MTATTNIKLSTPPHGANVNTWDADPVNNNAVILDAVFGSVTSKGLTNANVTLSATEAQVSVLRFSGALSGNVAINVGAVIKSWIVENTCTGGFVVTMTGGSGNVVGVPPGSSQVYWDGTNVSFVNLGKIGEYWDYGGSAVPAWVAACSVPPYLLCDGSTFSSGTYPLLAAILGTTTLPDSRARSRIPLDSGAGRVTTAGSGIDGSTRFASGGAQNVSLTSGQLAAHGHGVNDPQHQHFVRASGNGFAGGGAGVGIISIGPAGGIPGLSDSAATGISIQNTGNGDAHNNMPPAYVGGVTMIRGA